MPEVPRRKKVPAISVWHYLTSNEPEAQIGVVLTRKPALQQTLKRKSKSKWCTIGRAKRPNAIGCMWRRRRAWTRSWRCLGLRALILGTLTCPAVPYKTGRPGVTRRAVTIYGRLDGQMSQHITLRHLPLLALFDRVAG